MAGIGKAETGKAKTGNRRNRDRKIEDRIMKAGIKLGIRLGLLAALMACLSGCRQKGGYPLSQSVFLLNTFVNVTVYDSSCFWTADAREALEGSMDLCRQYEGILSRTIEGSDIYRLNHRAAGEREIQVAPETAQVIAMGLEYGEKSGGTLDITIEPLSSLWNFTGADPHVPGAEEIEALLPKVDYRSVRVEGDLVILEDDDTRLDLGAIAKGFIADRMKEYLVEEGITSAVINLGGNVLCIGERTDGTAFRIGLRRPFADYSETVATVDVRDCSVVSSGVYERHFVENGVNYHHLLNPQTGYPWENGLVQVTIISEQSVDGDGLSTACFGLGVEEGCRFLESLDGVYGIFMTEDGGLHYSKGAEEFVEAGREGGANSIS